MTDSSSWPRFCPSCQLRKAFSQHAIAWPCKRPMSHCSSRHTAMATFLSSVYMILPMRSLVDFARSSRRKRWAPSRTHSSLISTAFSGSAPGRSRSFDTIMSKMLSSFFLSCMLLIRSRSSIRSSVTREVSSSFIVSHCGWSCAVTLSTPD